MGREKHHSGWPHVFQSPSEICSRLHVPGAKDTAVLGFQHPNHARRTTRRGPTTADLPVKRLMVSIPGPDGTWIRPDDAPLFRPWDFQQPRGIGCAALCSWKTRRHHFSTSEPREATRYSCHVHQSPRSFFKIRTTRGGPTLGREAELAAAISTSETARSLPDEPSGRIRSTTTSTGFNNRAVSRAMGYADTRVTFQWPDRRVRRSLAEPNIPGALVFQRPDRAMRVRYLSRKPIVSYTYFNSRTM